MRLQKRGPQGDDAECFAREPEQDAAMGMCLNAYRDLGTERAIGMATGPIPWSECRDWCRYHGLDSDSTTIVWAVMCRLERDRFERENSKRNLNQGA
jgi:hypothetical protein